MKIFFIVVSVVVFDERLLLCEGRVRRQIWPAPANPFWTQNGIGTPDFYDNGNFWMGNSKFSQPQRNQNNFWEGFTSGGGRNDWNQNGGVNDWSQNGGRNDWRQNGGRRTTVEDLGPITSTPRTVHTAPQGCECPMTQQFNPVCGTDGNTYRNMGLLNCYKRCGTNVSEKRLGRC